MGADGRSGADLPVGTKPSAAASFGARLRAFRVRAGLSQEALAERAGLGLATLKALERDQRPRPHPHSLALLAKALDLAPADRAALLELVSSAPAQPAGPGPPLVAPAIARSRRLVRLPLAPTRLIGRDADVAQASTLLDPSSDSPRLLTLIGPGGVGKTRLALALEATLVDRYTDGAVFVDLAPLNDARLVPAAIARALDLHEAGGRSARELVLEYLHDRQLLLVLDNCEHLPGAARLVAELLASCAELKVLATSRSVLRVRAEHRFAVAPLAAADASQPLATIADAPAVQLFVARAQAISPAFVLTEANAGDVARICRHLDGLPLAIELAAARVSLLPPRALLGRLEHRLAGLTGGAVDLPERQRTLRNTLDWSYGLLEPSEQVLFAMLSVFAGGGTVAAAEAVCAPDGPIDLVDQLTALVDNSLVRQEGEPEPRIWLLETIREYAAEQLTQRGEQDTVRRRHADYFLAWAEAGAERAQGPEAAAWFDLLEQERGNLRVAFDWLAESGAAVEALRLAHAVAPFWVQRGPVHEARARLTELLALRGTEGRVARGAALLDAALLAWAEADYSAEQRLAESAVDAYRAAGDPSGYTHALGDLAAANCNAGAYDAARALAQRVLAAKPDRRDRVYWRALMVLASCARDEADFGTAARLYEQVLYHARLAGDGYWMGHALSNMGWQALFAGDAPHARECFEQALAVRRAIGQPREIAVSLTGMGHVALAFGDRDQAMALYQQCLAIHRQVGNLWGVAMVLEGYAGAMADEAPARALRLAGAGAALRTLIRRPMARAEQPIHARWLDPARRALGPAAAAAALSEGASLSMDEALADADEIVTTH